MNSTIFTPKDVEEMDAPPDFIFKDIIWDPYSKLYIATDEKKIYQIDFNSLEEKMRINTEEVVSSLVLTQRHLIASLDNKRIVWYSALPPEETLASQQVPQEDKLIQLQDEILQDYIFENGNVGHMSYTKSYKKLIIGCTDGFLSSLPVESEIYNEEEEEDEEGSVKEMKTINSSLTELGKFQII